jgi:hypothetical protein
LRAFTTAAGVPYASVTTLMAIGRRIAAAPRRLQSVAGQSEATPERDLRNRRRLFGE